MAAVEDARGQIALAADERFFDDATGARTRAHPGSDPGRPGCSFPTMPHHLSRRNDCDHRVTMTVPEAAEVLGMSESATHEAVARGEIPSVRIGRRVLIKRDLFLEMLTSTHDEQELQARQLDDSPLLPQVRAGVVPPPERLLDCCP
jgi:excisionase family DNA binding protein